MHIYRALSGESVSVPASKYRIMPNKLMEDNGLFIDKLAGGEELLILTPTRCATVRGGDTLSKFSLRYGVRKNSILANNPSLQGEDYLPPGKMLTVKYSPSPLGTASAIGFIRRGCSYEKFKLCIPYLTYVTAFEYTISEAGILRECNFSRYTDLALGRSRITMLGVTDKTNGAFLLRGGATDRIIEELADIATSGGYSGIFLSCMGAASSQPELLAEFILNARRRLIGRELMLFTDATENCGEIASLTDASVLHCGYDFEDGFTKSSASMKKFAGSTECGGCFFFISCNADASGENMTIDAARDIAKRNGKEIYHDEKTLLSHFSYSKFSKRGKEIIDVTFPSQKKLLAEYTLGAELGFMGYAFDIGRTPIFAFTMFNVLFSRADYMMISPDNM